MRNEKSPTQESLAQDELITDNGQLHSEGPKRKPLPAAAQRALAEAAERRAKAEQDAHMLPKELDGPKGPEPTRYGDWERKGIASDF